MPRSNERNNGNNIQIYCGNNRRHPDLLNGSKRLGTRYTCLQKGIQIGSAMEPDNNYATDYEPIDRTRKYCGDSRMPDNYDRFGTLVECLQKGIGVGKRRRSRQANQPNAPARRLNGGRSRSRSRSRSVNRRRRRRSRRRRS